MWIFWQKICLKIKVKYKNNFYEKQDFQNTFSRYSDFNSSENLADIETILIEKISEELIEDVFNKAFVNW